MAKKEGKEDPGSEIAQPALWNLIPEVFYDLIARVTPGVLLIAVFTWACVPVAMLAQIKEPISNAPTLAALGLIGAGYVVGFVISASTTWIFSVVNDIGRKFVDVGWLRKNLLKFGLPQLARARDMEKQLQILAINDPRAFARVAKMLAERSLIECLLAGLPIVAALRCHLAARTLAVSNVEIIAVMVMLVAAWISLNFALTMRVRDTLVALGWSKNSDDAAA